MSLSHSTDHGAESSRQTTLFGMWIFIATETLFFGGALFLYWATRHAYPETFALASLRLNAGLAGWNTAVLLTSSLTMALAIHKLKFQNLVQSSRLLALTAALGTLFLLIKGYEYRLDAQNGLLIGVSYHPDPSLPGPAALFFSIYLLLTGLHAIHLTIGIAWCLFTAARVARTPVNSSVAVQPATEVLGLYWHFVDIIWVLLLPLLYLIGTHA